MKNGALGVCTPHYLTNFVYNQGLEKTDMFGHVALQSGACSEWTVKTAMKGDVTVSTHVVSAGYDLQTEFLMVVPKSWDEGVDYIKECRNRRTTCNVIDCPRQNCIGLKADIRMCWKHGCGICGTGQVCTKVTYIGPEDDEECVWVWSVVNLGTFRYKMT